MQAIAEVNMLIKKDAAIKLLNKKNISKENQWKLSKKSIQHAINILKESAIADQISEVYLYGSCARGEQHYGSDVDLFVVLNKEFDAKQNHKDLIQIMSYIQPNSLELPQIDIKFEAGNNWKNRNDLYYVNIRRDGINIWNKQEIHTNI